MRMGFVAPRRSGFFPVLVLLLPMAAAGCGESGTDPLADGVLERYQMWFSRGIVDYSMDYVESCPSCPAERGDPVRLTVRGGVLTEVRSAEDGASLPLGPWEGEATVSGIFQRVLNHLEQEGATVVIQYDQGTDVPLYTQAFLSDRPNAGFVIVVSNFTPE